MVKALTQIIFLGCLILTSSVKCQCQESDRDSPFVVVLGIAQDAGYPQSGCRKSCCIELWDDKSRRLDVASLGIVDPVSGERWMIDCTPSFPDQLDRLNRLTDEKDDRPILDGILLTHAHMGHYSGLMHLGREAMGAREVPVHAMTRMSIFLENNGPWSLLVELKNIRIERMVGGEVIRLNERLSIVPIPVPHRDEFSETVGFVIRGPEKELVYIPDIDKWEKWDVRIEDVIEDVDHALLDGTFFENGEIPGRDMSEIPHPFIEESMSRFAKLPDTERSKIRFIHLNHTNPALDPESDASKMIKQRGFGVARQGDQIEL